MFHGVVFAVLSACCLPWAFSVCREPLCLPRPFFACLLVRLFVFFYSSVWGPVFRLQAVVSKGICHKIPEAEC